MHLGSRCARMTSPPPLACLLSWPSLILRPYDSRACNRPFQPSFADFVRGGRRHVRHALVRVVRLVIGAAEVTGCFADKPHNPRAGDGACPWDDATRDGRICRISEEA